MTNEQAKVIKKLKAVIKQCEKNEIFLFGMDESLLFATKEAIEDAEKRFDNIGNYYNTAADTYKKLQYENDPRIGTIVSGTPYVDSGGW